LFDTTVPLVRVQDSCQQLIIELYRSLLHDHAVITGVNLSPAAEFKFDKAGSIKNLLHFFANLNKAFPEYELNIENLATRGAKVMSKYTVSGFQADRLLGNPPAYNLVKVNCIDIFRLSDNNITEYWNLNRQIE
jgi:predicted SnoaL-like aldol condensation-catalyzing enzyme